jgi:hypothetical protein
MAYWVGFSIAQLLSFFLSLVINSLPVHSQNKTKLSRENYKTPLCTVGMGHFLTDCDGTKAQPPLSMNSGSNIKSVSE